VTTREKAKELSADPKMEIRIVSLGFARTKKAFMAAAVAPSAQMALDNAGIKAVDLGAIKTHNPFAANDLVMAKVMGLDANGMNNFGSSLIFGHPQAPTGARLMIEGIEELAMKGGGTCSSPAAPRATRRPPSSSRSAERIGKVRRSRRRRGGAVR